MIAPADFCSPHHHHHHPHHHLLLLLLLLSPSSTPFGSHHLTPPLLFFSHHSLEQLLHSSDHLPCQKSVSSSSSPSPSPLPYLARTGLSSTCLGLLGILSLCVLGNRSLGPSRRRGGRDLGKEAIHPLLCVRPPCLLQPRQHVLDPLLVELKPRDKKLAQLLVVGLLPHQQSLGFKVFGVGDLWLLKEAMNLLVVEGLWKRMFRQVDVLDDGCDGLVLFYP
mmetsp:Transcript_12711/g.44505  ORF Transcript_12711/g.44505 Transcript_12711/m.44505 type:complete len:221 (-) Transcript_12711:748-1410(-)